ncbi:MAG: hypothetical protein LBK83_14550 [Treponema sp.]|jgi:hypothetical protein|nr:hypothetical protein [Treponema sp.]
MILPITGIAAKRQGNAIYFFSVKIPLKAAYFNEDILVSRDGIDKPEGTLSFREQCPAIQLLDKFLTDSTVEDRKPEPVHVLRQNKI